MKHTPTRWFLHRPTTADHWEVRAQAKKPPVKVLADVWAAGDTKEESYANAKLIAAAPELLAIVHTIAHLYVEECARCNGSGQQPHCSVEEACHTCGGSGKVVMPDITAQVVEEARALIAKATE